MAPRTSTRQTHGLQVVETQSLRQENAIGLVCNFKRSNGSAERNVRSFSMAAQFYMPLFMKLLASTGAELENMVYTKGQASHYFVMTPTHRCLIDAGVIMDRTHQRSAGGSAPPGARGSAGVSWRSTWDRPGAAQTSGAKAVPQFAPTRALADTRF